MPSEPEAKRANIFFDGQNLFYGAKEAFGYPFPNYDPVCLAQKVCDLHGFQLQIVHFYTGVPDAGDNAFWNGFWNRKLAALGTRGVRIFTRPLRYRNKAISLPSGTSATVLIGQEKGIDVRIALDVVRQARENVFDIAVVFSQDQDLSEMADEVKRISMDRDRWIKVVSAFPRSPTYPNKRGINQTDWFPFDRAFYDACIDPYDYRPTMK